MAETPKNPLILDSFDKKHLQQIAALENKVAAIYAELCKEVGVVGTLFGGKVDLGKVFKLGDYPEINKKVDQIIESLHNRLSSAIVDGVTAQWQLANEKNDDLVRKVFGKDLDNLTEDQITRYFTSNQSALDAFLKRKDKGLGLSQKVWKYAKEAKVDIESALELGIKTGQSAASMARDLKQYLKEPDKLFRRVRDKDGKLHLSKAAQAYHPGQGVYRSSYKNALRLAVTEANMAYRASDYERVQNFDFVVGIEVRLSNNHTLNGKPFYDICDELKGKYPKDFKFRGWHPFCRCHAITILKTREELMADNERILDGQEPAEDSVNSVNDLPDNFKAWAVKNKSRILAADEKGTLPYFITDNPYSVNSAIGQPLASVKVPLWYAHNAQVKEVQGKLKEIKQWSYEHPKSKKIVGLINDTDAAISNGAAIEDILARFEAANKEYKGKLWEAEYVAKKKAEAAKRPTALDIAKKRHEARTQQQIDQTKIEWTARRLNRLKDKIYDELLPMESYDRITQLYVLLLKEHKFDEVNKGIATLQKAVARHKARTPEKIKAIKDAWNLRKEAILKDEQFLSALIPNVKDWKKQFSSKKLHEVYDAVEKKMQQINALPLNKQVAAINKEILYVSDATYLKPHTLYSTWEVSQAAYQVQLGIVQKKVGLTSVWDTLDDIDLWLYKHPKVKKLSGMVDEVKDLINSGADMSEINLKMSAINTEYKNKLYEEQYAARLKAKKMYSSAYAQDRGVSRLYKGGDPYTEAEKAELFKRETDIIDKIFSDKRVTSYDIEKYHDYALQLSEKYYKKQVSVYSADEIAELQRIIKKYTTRQSTNPGYIWGADLGGVYGKGSSKWYKVTDYMTELTGLTPAEVSVAKRFTNGSTFSNCYNLYKESPYWRQKFLSKVDGMKLSKIKEQFTLIEEYSQSANYVLDRMVRYNGITFRGLSSGGGPEVRAQLLKAFNSGKPWVNNASCSTSIKHSVAESFDGDTILIIHNKTGAWIHPISDYSHEFEVMTKRGAKYRVIKPPTYTNGRWYAELEEII